MSNNSDDQTVEAEFDFIHTLPKSEPEEEKNEEAEITFIHTLPKP